MTQIQGGMNPHMAAALQAQTPAVQAPPPPVKVAPAAPVEAPKVPTGPSQTTLTTQKVLALTSEGTEARLLQLLQTAKVQPGVERPPLQILGRGESMGSALAQALASHQTPEGAASQAAQTMAGQQQAATHLREGGAKGTSSWQSKPLNKHTRREEHGGEFNLMDDSAGQGMSGGDSDQQKQKDRQQQQEAWGKPSLKKVTPAPLKRSGDPPKPPLGAPPKPPASRRQPGGF